MTKAIVRRITNMRKAVLGNGVRCRKKKKR